MRSIAGKEGIEEKKGKEKRRAFCTALIFYSGSDPFGGVFLVASNVFCWHSWLFLLFFIKCQTPLFSLFFFPFSSSPARRFSLCLLKKAAAKTCDRLNCVMLTQTSGYFRERKDTFLFPRRTQRFCKPSLFQKDCQSRWLPIRAAARPVSF